MRIATSPPDPALLSLPWSVPLADWTEHVIPLPRGLSRHVVRIVRVGDRVYAVKETQEEMAHREYRLLRELEQLGLPAVDPVAVVTDRPGGLPAALVTQHLMFALPYRSLFTHGMRADSLPVVIDALVVLLVRLHLAGFYWGDVSLSNVLFRRNAGALAAYLVDAETGELHATISDRMREYDLTVGCENVFAELLDLRAGGLIGGEFDPRAIIAMIRERYDTLWNELTSEEHFSADELWRIDQRVERLNDLGFDVDELDIVTDDDGDTVRIRPKVVEAGHHSRELRFLTGLDVEDGQARRLLNDIAAFTAAHGLSHEPRHIVAGRWVAEIFERIVSMVPPELRGRLPPAELFHEILIHRWHLSERAGHEVDTFDAARDFIDHHLADRHEELIPIDDPDALL